MNIAQEVLSKLKSVQEETTVTLSCPPLPTPEEQNDRVKWLSDSGINAVLGVAQPTDILVPADQSNKAITLLSNHGCKAVLAEAKYTFKKISANDFERLGSSQDYEESEIDGNPVTVFYKGKNCVAISYKKAGVISSCPEFKGDLIDYSESDSLWPYG